MLLQEHIERETEAPLGKPAWAAMTRDAAFGEQPRPRFALIEIFGAAGSTAQRGYGAKCEHNKGEQNKGEQTTSDLRQQLSFRRYAHAVPSPLAHYRRSLIEQTPWEP